MFIDGWNSVLLKDGCRLKKEKCNRFVPKSLQHSDDNEETIFGEIRWKIKDAINSYPNLMKK